VASAPVGTLRILPLLSMPNSMQQKGPRYKTEPFRLWFRLQLKLCFSYSFGTTITFTLASTSPWT
jgi:hypothetical protein